MASCSSRCLPLLVLAFLAATLAAQDGTPAKASEQDYPAHAKLANLSIGAEYLVHSFSSGREMFIAKDYLVVEVAIFPLKGGNLDVHASQFRLRVNGRQALSPQAGEFVANSLKYPDQDRGPHAVAGLGPIVLGQPGQTGRFPGDPNGRTAPPPDTPSPNSDAVEHAPPVTAAELVVKAALPEGERHAPTAGFLYFPYRGKVSRIHSLELLFSGTAGNVTLPLM